MIKSFPFVIFKVRLGKGKWNMKKLAHFIYYKSKLIIGIVIVINIIALLSFYNFSFSTDYLAFFKGNDEMAAAYDEISQKYEGIETIQVLIDAEATHSSITDKNNLMEVASYIDKIEEIDGVNFVQSFLPKQVPSPKGPVEIDKSFIDTHYEELILSIEASPFTKHLLSEDNQLGLVMLGISDEADKDAVVDELQAVTIGQNLSLDYAGNQIIVSTLFDYLFKIILIFPPLAILLVLLTFYLNIRVKKLTLFAMLPAALGALWTFGTLFLLGKELSIITVVVPIFIIVLGSADGLHFTIHYLDHSSSGKSKIELIEDTLRMVGIPIIMTTLTTMAGFLSLSFADITSMKDLGISTALGIGYAGIISLFFLPALLSRTEIDVQYGLKAKDNKIIHLLKSIVKRPILIITTFAVIVITLGSFIPTLIVDSNQLGFFKKGSEIRDTFEKIEEHFGSSLPIIGEYKMPENGLLDVAYANEILDLERATEERAGIEKVVSAYDFVLYANAQLSQENKYPEQQQNIPKILDQLHQFDMVDTNQWISDDGIKFMITTSNLSGEEQDILIEELRNNPNIKTLTGMPILFREMNKLIVDNQISSLFIALLLVTIMLGISFRNIKNTFVGLIPIVLTVTSLFGFLAITNMNLNMMTANMSSIAIGVGIDYSIHFIAVMSYYQRLKHDNYIEKTIETAGRPILTNALGLVIGLSVFLLSPFRIHSQVSLVMWLAMSISSLSAILLIPQFYRRKKVKQ